jgi:hypothetical protein
MTSVLVIPTSLWGAIGSLLRHGSLLSFGSLFPMRVTRLFRLDRFDGPL